jgi:hypothetical protein
VRCHLGVDPQERTAEEHTTRGPHTTLAIFGREILGGTVSRVWSLWIVRCEGGTYLARTSTTNASLKRSSMSCLPEWTAGEVVETLAELVEAGGGMTTCEALFRRATTYEPDD